METIQTNEQLQEFAEETALGCKRFDVLKKQLETAKARIKKYMVDQDMDHLDKDGIKMLSITTSRTNVVDEKKFMNEEKEAYENWLYFRNKYTVPKFQTKLNWHNLNSLFPDDEFNEE